MAAAAVGARALGSQLFRQAGQQLALRAAARAGELGREGGGGGGFEQFQQAGAFAQQAQGTVQRQLNNWTSSVATTNAALVRSDVAGLGIGSLNQIGLSREAGAIEGALGSFNRAAMMGNLAGGQRLSQLGIDPSEYARASDARKFAMVRDVFTTNDPVRMFQGQQQFGEQYFDLRRQFGNSFSPRDTAVDRFFNAFEEGRARVSEGAGRAISRQGRSELFRGMLSGDLGRMGDVFTGPSAPSERQPTESEVDLMMAQTPVTGIYGGSGAEFMLNQQLRIMQNIKNQAAPPRMDPPTQVEPANWERSLVTTIRTMITGGF